jgi:hypothetical protein
MRQREQPKNIRLREQLAKIGQESRQQTEAKRSASKHKDHKAKRLANKGKRQSACMGVKREATKHDAKRAAIKPKAKRADSGQKPRDQPANIKIIRGKSSQHS